MSSGRKPLEGADCPLAARQGSLWLVLKERSAAHVYFWLALERIGAIIFNAMRPRPQR